MQRCPWRVQIHRINTQWSRILHTIEVKKLDDTESVHNDIIMMKNGMYRFIMNNQLFINCYKIWHIYNNLLLLTIKYLYITCIYCCYFPIFLYSGGYVRRGLCPQGVLSAGGFIQGVMSAGGFVRRGLCPRLRNNTPK